MDKRSTFRGLAILSVTFLLGSVTGAFAGRSIPAGSVTETLPLGSSLSQSLLSLILFPSIAVLLGTSLLGGFLLPLLTGVKGFTLSFSLSAVFSTLAGMSEMWQMLRPRAIPMLISVVVLFILSNQAMKSSLTLFKLGVRVTVSERLYDMRYWVNVVLCALTLVVTAVLSAIF